MWGWLKNNGVSPSTWPMSMVFHSYVMHFFPLFRHLHYCWVSLFLYSGTLYTLFIIYLMLLRNYYSICLLSPGLGCFKNNGVSPQAAPSAATSSFYATSLIISSPSLFLGQPWAPRTLSAICLHNRVFDMPHVVVLIIFIHAFYYTRET